MVYTLFLYSLDPYGQIDRQTDRRTEKQTHSLRVGWRNLPTLCVGWRNLFSSCAIVSVFCSGRKLVLVVHTTMYLEYHTVVVLCQLFWFWRDIVFGVTYVLSVQYRLLLRPEKKRFKLEKKQFQSSVWQVRDRYYNRKKKFQSSVWRVRDRYYNRKKVLVMIITQKLNVSNLNVTNLYQFQL